MGTSWECLAVPAYQAHLT